MKSRIINVLAALSLCVSSCSGKLSIPSGEQQNNPARSGVSEQWSAQLGWLDRQEDGDYLLFVGRYDKAEHSFKEAVKKAENDFGTRDQRLGRSLSGLADAELGAREYKLAAEHYKQALAIKSPSPGEESTEVADLMTHLAQCQLMLGNIKEARSLIEHSLPVNVKLKNTASLPESYFVRAMVNMKSGNLELAKSDFRLASDGFERDLPSLDYPTSTMTMRTALECLKRYSELVKEPDIGKSDDRKNDGVVRLRSLSKRLERFIAILDESKFRSLEQRTVKGLPE